MIAVTGANGFIGSRLVRDLEAGGAPVRAIVRSNSARIVAGRATRCVGDVHDDRFLRGALEGASAVVHLAGRAHHVRDTAADPEREFREVNVRFTDRVARAAMDVGVQRLVFLSTVAAATGDTATVVDDNVVPSPQTPYGRSKREAELLLAEYQAAGRLDVVSLRPPAVYGPGARGNPLRLMRLVSKGVPLPFGALEGRRSFIAVQNLVAAIRAAVQMPAPEITPYFVDEGTALTTPEFVRMMERSLQKRARLLNVPLAILRLVGAAGSALEAGLSLSVPVTSYEIDRLAGSLVINGDRFRSAASFRPVVAPQVAMDEAAEWLLRVTQQ